MVSPWDIHTWVLGFRSLQQGMFDLDMAEPGPAIFPGIRRQYLSPKIMGKILGPVTDPEHGKSSLDLQGQEWGHVFPAPKRGCRKVLPLSRIHQAQESD
jgi:hypothetical protein